MGKTVFTNGDKGLGIQGTRVTAEVLNGLQSHRHDGVDADGSAPLDYAVDTGAADVYAIALTPPLTAHVAGLPIAFKAAHANTGASTIAVNGLAAKPLKRAIGTDLIGGDIVAGQVAVMIYDGANYQMVNPVVTGGVRQTVYVSTANLTRIDSAPIPIDNTVPQSNEGAQIIPDAVITPRAVGSIVEVDVSLQIGCYGRTNGMSIAAALFKDGGANAVRAALYTDGQHSNSNLDVSMQLRYRMVTTSLDPITFKVRAGASATDEVYVNGFFSAPVFGGAVRISDIKITELAAV